MPPNQFITRSRDTIDDNSRDYLFTSLPVELLLHLFHFLDHRSLAALCATCTVFNKLVVETGWKDFCRFIHRDTPSETQRWQSLTWGQRARESHLINAGWVSRRFLGRNLNAPWRSKHLPIVALSPSRLVVAVGHMVTSYRFDYDHTRQASAVKCEGNFVVFQDEPTFDITGLTFLPDGGKNEMLLVSSLNGTLVRVQLPLGIPQQKHSTNQRRRQSQPPFLQAHRTASYPVGNGSLRALASQGNTAIALTSTGTLHLLNAATPWIPPNQLATGNTSWSTHLQLTASLPYTAIGTAKNVSIYDVEQGMLSRKPRAILSGPGRETPVFCIGEYLPGGPPELITSGWYDGKVRIHDLRCSTRQRKTSDSEPPSLVPVMTLSDPWRSFDPVYSLAARAQMSDESERERDRITGLPHQHHYVIAGSAMHSVVCLWDVRNPSDSWSTYVASGDRSPIYSLKAEGSRIWGATQHRAFVMDFSPDAHQTEFPLLENPSTYNSTYSHVR
ncbi:hypothetical protein PIIN_01445 [Serendipita indica DSM 11827]|uniref:F-box domain-containing protein n=1 Tax=Serendipita indica (strain DSM 11827) TaxID=1109443 RepID=G4T8H4_SERID|nr:hypothetical protein PIIN_01445 [Serendipita indica DSM 11827]